LTVLEAEEPPVDAAAAAPANPSAVAASAATVVAVMVNYFIVLLLRWCAECCVKCSRFDDYRLLVISESSHVTRQGVDFHLNTSRRCEPLSCIRFRRLVGLLDLSAPLGERGVVVVLEVLGGQAGLQRGGVDAQPADAQVSGASVPRQGSPGVGGRPRPPHACSA
jgi:hypothetical protein